MTAGRESPLWRKVGRWVRYAPDRILHPWRRTRARRTLRELAPRVRAVLFVCYGNICRSPFAAESFSALTSGTRSGAAPRAFSSGFHRATGRRPPDAAVAAARDRGVDLSDHRSSGVHELRGHPADPADRSVLVMVMDAGQRERMARGAGAERRRILVLGDLDPEPVERRAILDPYGKAPEVFEQVYDRIERCVWELAEAMGEGGRHQAG